MTEYDTRDYARRLGLVEGIVWIDGVPVEVWRWPRDDDDLPPDDDWRRDR